jgi:hypothetical protein
MKFQDNAQIFVLLSIWRKNIAREKVQSSKMLKKLYFNQFLTNIFKTKFYDNLGF